MENLKVLVIGSGGREHAIVHALAQDPNVAEVHAIPGNPGIGLEAQVHAGGIDDNDFLVHLAKKLEIDLVVVGPEAPLVSGLVDALQAAQILVFGPSSKAAQLEGSKSFAKEIMTAAQVPTAASFYCTNEAQYVSALQTFGAPYVVKADGLAAGKGVVVTEDLEVALAHAKEAGTVVIEEYLDGPEVSLFSICDGSTAIPLLPAQDFKRESDADQGRNTGGMGSYAPLPWVSKYLVETVMKDIVQPTLQEMARRGTPFSGLLYTGLALTSKGPKVVEFNARFGDPETQAVLSLLKTPLSQVLYASATGTLEQLPNLEWRDGFAVCVVMAAQGYPGSAPKGLPIAYPVGADYVLHAGTKLDELGQLVSNGGRVLNILGLGDTLATARENAYGHVAQVDFPGGYTRSDIALRAAENQIVVP